MARTPFAPPALDGQADVRTPTDLPRPSFGRQGAGRERGGYRRYSLADGAVPATDAMPRVDSPGPAANDMGPGPELANLRDQARREGHAEGFEQGMAQARAHTETTLQRYAAALDALESLHAEVVEGYRRAMLDVAVGVAEAAIQRSIDRTTIEALANQALAAFAGDEVERMELRVSPEDAKRLEAWTEARRAAGLELAVHVDDSLEDGDLIARCGAGSLHTRLAERLERALAAVRGTPESPTSTGRGTEDGA